MTHQEQIEEFLNDNNIKYYKDLDTGQIVVDINQMTDKQFKAYHFKMYELQKTNLN